MLCVRIGAIDLCKRACRHDNYGRAKYIIYRIHTLHNARTTHKKIPPLHVWWSCRFFCPLRFGGQTYRDMYSISGRMNEYRDEIVSMNWPICNERHIVRCGI